MEKHPFLFYSKDVLLLHGKLLFYYLEKYFFVIIILLCLYKEIIVILLQFVTHSRVSGYDCLPPCRFWVLYAFPSFCFIDRNWGLQIFFLCLSPSLLLWCWYSWWCPTVSETFFFLFLSLDNLNWLIFNFTDSCLHLLLSP